MPFIRDFASAYEASTSEGGITIPMCNYQQNDLLLVFAMSDTGAGTWGCSGYTKLFERLNTSAVVCYYKIAGASEGDVVVTATTAETYNGIVIAIGDIDTTYPLGNPAQYSETTATGTRVAMPQVTTQRDNSLIIFHAASSGSNAGIHFVEGELHELAISDGSAEGQGVGWLLQKTAGLSSSSIYADCPLSSVTKAAIVINPPSGGATVIPPHCVSDDSQYLEPNSTAGNFDSNTFMAATADTYFGTSIAGKTANDATVAISADIGVNSFHGMMGLTNATTAGQMSGANLLLASSRYNVGNRNVLAHFRHTTPAHNQRLSNIGSGRGVWMGLKSGTSNGANWKVWQVHGSDAVMVAGYIQPLIVNPANTDTIATNGTLSNSDVRQVGFWNGGLGILTNQSCIGPIWTMDTLAMAGGSASLPIGITEIVDVAARAKERLSSIQQGANQMLCLQKIQLGNGGTNPIYVLLDSTAIEFPSKKNASKKIVNYNGIDDSVGLIYYPGSSDTIIHKNSIISSANRYAWGLHASASTSATYDFSGLAVIGAGTITLNRAITINGLTINSYVTIDASNVTLNGCTIKGCPAANDSLTTNASTNIDNSQITVTGVSAGNRMCSVADPTIFSGCAFIGSGSTGHAIRITSPGTYSFVGNTFTGFGADGTNYAAIFNDSGGAVTINVSGGGSSPTVRNGSGASTTVNNNVTVTLTGLKNPSEVRVFNTGTQTERSGTGAENVTTGTHAFSLPASTGVDISILSLGYQNMRILNYSTTADATIPISQVLDRQYANP